MSVTVVVPTHDRQDFVPDLVAALEAQTHPGLLVRFVDDGSHDATAATARRAIGDDPRFEVLCVPNRGPAAARNTGCDGVGTEWVAFTDDDCLPEPDWLAALVAAAEESGADVVQGRTIPDPTVPRASMPWYSRSQHIPSWSGRFQTCNLLVRTEALRAVGGFDERFPPQGFGEDTDLGLRLLRHGVATAFADRAVVRHRILPMGYLDFVRRRYRWAQVVRLVAVNPDARTVFPHPYVAYRAHVAFWMAAPIGIWATLTGRWGVIAAGAAGYGAVQGARNKDKGRRLLTRAVWGATELPGLAAASVGFVIESVRNRTLLL